MNKKAKFAAVLAAGMAIGGASGTYAAGNIESIRAYLNHAIGIEVNGKSFAMTDASGNAASPITYKDTTYLPVRSLSQALGVELRYDAERSVILIGSETEETADPGEAADPIPAALLVPIVYTPEQINEMKEAFGVFEGFEDAFAPTEVPEGEAFVSAVPGADGVSIIFSDMRAYVSPRDYASDFETTEVTLPNRAIAKRYESGGRVFLNFRVGDRFVDLSSPNGGVTEDELETVATTFERLD